MRVLVIFCFVALSVAILTPSKVILADNKLSKRVDGQYIVVFHPNTTAERRNAHIEGYGSKVFHTYEIGDSFFGYAAKFTQQDLVAAAQKDEVKYIEEDKLMHAVADSCVKQTGATWGIDRIAEKAINLDENYVYTSSAGSGVDAYVIDTGILTTHKDFEGRAKFGINTVGDGNKEDCNGHGTHVAGTIGSLTYGVAKKTTLIAVKVLGCNGSGTNTGVIAGINWVTDQYKNTKKPSVANMSLGGSKSQATNDAVASAVKAGVTMVVAAGNENQDACNVSPASEPVAITVGATDIGDSGSDQVDVRSSFSNYGTCVKILAPGSLITSLWIGSSNTATRTISGTSMASPHIAGSAALFLGNNPTATPTEVKDHLVSTASTGIVNLLCSSGTSCSRTPNKFVYNHCD